MKGHCRVERQIVSIDRHAGASAGRAITGEGRRAALSSKSIIFRKYAYGGNRRRASIQARYTASHTN